MEEIRKEESIMQPDPPCVACRGTRACGMCGGSGERQVIPDCFEDACYADCGWCNATGYCAECCADKVWDMTAKPLDRDTESG